MTPADERRIAEAATPGEWIAFGTDVGHVIDGCNCGPMGTPGHEAYCGIEGPIAQASEADAEFIATFNPARVLQLLDRLAAVEKLHPNIHGECHTCSNENGPLNWPCPTIKEVRGE